MNVNMQPRIYNLIIKTIIWISFCVTLDACTVYIVFDMLHDAYKI